MTTVLMIDCSLQGMPPTGKVFIVDGDGSFGCAYCRTIVYPHAVVIRNHDFVWDGYRMTWHSRDFDVRVHACAEEEANLVETRELTTGRIGA